MSTDSINWNPAVRVHKYNPETVADITRVLGHHPTFEDLARIAPDDIAVAEGNLLVTGGLTRIANLIVGTASTNPFNSTRGLIGVGDGTTDPTTVGMTDLQGTNKLYVPVSAQPGVSGGAISASALFDTGDANFAWAEWCFAIGSGTTVKSSSLNTAGGGTGLMLNRKPQSLGTKASGAQWTLNATVTLS